jgi:hypothetical protein
MEMAMGRGLTELSRKSREKKKVHALSIVTLLWKNSEP